MRRRGATAGGGGAGRQHRHSQVNTALAACRPGPRSRPRAGRGAPATRRGSTGGGRSFGPPRRRSPPRAANRDRPRPPGDRPRSVRGGRHDQLAIAYRRLGTWQIEPRPRPRRSALAGGGGGADRGRPPTGVGHRSSAWATSTRSWPATRPRPASTRAPRWPGGRRLPAGPRAQSARRQRPNNLGNAWKVLAEVRLAQGLDPTEPLDRAVTALARAAELKPTSAAFQNNLGSVHLTPPTFSSPGATIPGRLSFGPPPATGAPSPSTPTTPCPASTSASPCAPSPSTSSPSGGDVSAILAEAHLTLDRAIDLNPTDADGYLERARIDLVATRQALAHREDPGDGAGGGRQGSRPRRVDQPAGTRGVPRPSPPGGSAGGVGPRRRSRSRPGGARRPGGGRQGRGDQPTGRPLPAPPRAPSTSSPPAARAIPNGAGRRRGRR